MPTDTVFAPKADASLIRAANERIEAATGRRNTAHAELLAAQQAHNEAERALQAALRGDGAQTPSVAHEVLDSAERRVLLAEKVAAACEQVVTEQIAARKRATAEAHLPLMKHAIAERVAACEDFQGALSALEAAKARSLAANSIISEAQRGGFDHGIDGNQLPPIVHHDLSRAPEAYRTSLRTPQAETALWGHI